MNIRDLEQKLKDKEKEFGKKFKEMKIHLEREQLMAKKESEEKIKGFVNTIKSLQAELDAERNQMTA